jgi:hypothetical protein
MGKKSGGSVGNMFLNYMVMALKVDVLQHLHC